MKTYSILIWLAAIAITFTSCDKNDLTITPSANIVTQAKTITDFNALDISDQFKVLLTFSETESVEIEANANLMSHIQVSKSGNSLRIKLDDNLNIRWGEATLNVYISMRALNKLSAEGATRIFLQNDYSGDKLDVSLTGASSLNGTLYVNNLNAQLVGASNMHISGSSVHFIVDATGASNMESYDFVTDKLDADLEGASNMKITVDQSMDVRASGASHVFYMGNAVVNSQHLTGASSIVKMH